MFRSSVNTTFAVVAIASLGMYSAAASGHSLRHGIALHAKKHASVISQYHPYVGVPALDAQNGWLSATDLNSPAPAMVATEMQRIDLSLCRMTGYFPNYAAAFEAACAKGSEIASTSGKKFF